MNCFSRPLLAAALLGLAGNMNAGNVQLHGRTWTDRGRIMHSTDTLQINFSGNWQQSMGVQDQS